MHLHHLNRILEGQNGNCIIRHCNKTREGQNGNCTSALKKGTLEGSSRHFSSSQKIPNKQTQQNPLSSFSSNKVCFLLPLIFFLLKFLHFAFSICYSVSIFCFLFSVFCFFRIVFTVTVVSVQFLYASISINLTNSMRESRNWYQITSFTQNARTVQL